MKPNAASDTAPEPRCATDVRRRRLFKSGLAAAPVVLTLASRPVLAATCQSPSKWGSANVSNPKLVNFNGAKTLVAWQTTATGSFPAPLTGADRFDSLTVFGSSPRYGNATLLDVLNGPTTSQLDQNLLVAFLNITVDPNAGMCVSTTELNEMFLNGPDGTYQPTAGVNWGVSQISTYLAANGLLG